ncbi:GlsB/YeaQ/YmgE family stress response membrane protein [Priestia megaterium]|uniref:GlsB/YeaQ/YmgE family stress response membrane protein n=1 Tax=Priestia megaterium TaxID=1404 RepID=UPI0027319C45|nr:GlsB/YeaQ/YmgE family stress response membrane protein [Priestia megaterium]MDP1383638.1 GlsB/YeaQ/YmgE family stress response membrane protein [Priestia megaterium]MDP1427789.1 GlsB/YeaQ/YmgE family stress response membrane protein [Priestia megaterium]
MEILWMLIVGGIIGWLAGLITGRDVPGGIIGNIIAGFIGSWLGGLILGSWGPVIGGFAIIPAIIGSIILVLIVSFILRKMGQKKNHDHHAK